jgi:iron complex outermembrane receptor protein
MSAPKTNSGCGEKRMKVTAWTISMLAVAVCLQSSAASAQEAQGAASGTTDEIIVTATKKAEGQTLQKTALAMSAIGSAQIEAKQIRDLAGLGNSIPNVSFDSGGTFKGTANFSIRGLGVNSSIPSLEPSVGVFVDGVYQGINAGILFDTFDLEKLEILRGPQGLLFGRNVTGGAVLVSTKRPTQDFSVSLRAGIETGSNVTVAGSFSGPIAGDTVLGKLAVYYNDDGGWFTNSFNNQKFGGSRTFIVRPAIEFKPAPGLDLLLRFEHGDQKGDGAAAQNFALYSRNSFDFSNDTPAYSRSNWNQGTAELNADVGFGSGRITNVFGWRQFEQAARVDTDASPLPASDSYTFTKQEQFSNELRYAGTFANIVDVTTGVFYFKQNLDYQDARRANNASTAVYSGGIQDSHSWAWFSSADFHISDSLTLNTGLRYSYEKKTVSVASQDTATAVGTGVTSVDIIPAGACNIVARQCVFDFRGTKSWSSWIPKLGFEWTVAPTNLLYAFWTKGVRSGGYNVRNSFQSVAPGPFEPENVDDFEVGNKLQLFDKRLTFNNAVYYQKVKGLQRSVIIANGVNGSTAAFIRNTADATIWGVESEVRVNPTPELSLNASVGYTHGQYDKMFFDLTGNGVIDATDLALKLPRLSPWTVSAGFSYTHEAGGLGNVTLAADYSYRDRSFYNDSNTGALNVMHMVNGSISLQSSDRRWTASLYGKNLLNKVQFGGVTPIRGLPGATLAPLEKGRVVGFDIRLQY